MTLPKRLYLGPARTGLIYDGSENDLKAELVANTSDVAIAAELVRRWNAHEDLVMALRSMLSPWDGGLGILKSHAALAALDTPGTPK